MVKPIIIMTKTKTNIRIGPSIRDSVRFSVRVRVRHKNRT